MLSSFLLTDEVLEQMIEKEPRMEICHEAYCGVGKSRCKI